MLHGECVAIGMVAALYYSMECGNTTKEDIENIEKLLEFFELPIRCDNNVDDANVLGRAARSHAFIELT